MKAKNEFINYLEKSINYLSGIENGWVKEHPAILERLKNWKWEEDLSEIKERLQTTYGEIKEKAIDMISFLWDDQNASNIFIHIKGEGVEEEKEVIPGLEDCIEPWEWPEYHVEIDVVNIIFSDIEDWGSLIDGELELFHTIFHALVEVAVLELIDSESFKRLDLQKDYSIISFLWHDDNHATIYDTIEGIDYELEFDYE
ncbi:hypothetical protein [uncultured Aquimarina sp.]|uniref:hypothetical protein n=1 Tax=uncultured Aquimarina sp. TaxID=575652 RepID=UPI0026397C22|nr:hypothetical protein [uncultured Aquimarina sp.]